MRRWLWGALARIRTKAQANQVSFTRKAKLEMKALELGLDVTDAGEVLEHLTPADFARRIRSRTTDEWMYVFIPRVAGTLIYVKVILRSECVVVSFHEEVRDLGEEDSP
ncbi:MAG: type II toxin-antitoxin system MqsR family toxin [Candidatus Eisenbacteria bacterium]